MIPARSLAMRMPSTTPDMTREVIVALWRGAAYWMVRGNMSWGVTVNKPTRNENARKE